jgi:hypothetical protein
VKEAAFSLVHWAFRSYRKKKYDQLFPEPKGHPR